MLSGLKESKFCKPKWLVPAFVAFFVITTILIILFQINSKTVGSLTLVKTLNYGDVLSFSKLTSVDLLASGNKAGTVAIWNLTMGRIIKNLTWHTDWVNSLKYLPISGYLASASDDRTIQIWNYQSGQMIRLLSGHTNYVRSIEVLNDGRLASAGNFDRTMKVWNVNSGLMIRSISFNESVDSVVLLINGNVALLSSYSPNFYIVNPNNGELVKKIVNKDRLSDFNCQVVLSDGNLALGESTGRISIYNLSSEKIVKYLIGHKTSIECLVVLSDGRLVSGDYNGEIRVWNAQSGELLNSFKAHTKRIRALEALSDGRLVSSANDYLSSGEIKIWK